MKNGEGYNDPTAGEAWKHIKRDERNMRGKPVCIVIPGEPVPQGRPRFARHAGYVQAYDPKQSKNYKSRILSYVWMGLKSRAYTSFTDDGMQLAVSIGIYRSIPKSWSQKKKEAAAQGKVRPVSRPDTDNYVKIVLDAMNKVLWKDDSAVVSLHAEKWYSETPRMEITVQAIGENER